MQRRFALAGALAFTIVVTFAVVTLGSRAQLFGTHKKDAGAAQAQAAAAPSQAAAAAAPPAAAPQPEVVTEYVYVDAPGGQRAAAAPVGAAQQPPAAAAAPSSAPAPTQPPPSPAASRPTASAASPTARPAPSATPPPAPTSAPALASEIEFAGTVTAVSGSMVTFAYGSTSTVVQVSNTSLQVGAQAHVHARLVNGVYVADEIELGGN